MAKTLGVGIIGASADRGWAKISHVPAVQQLAGLELVAVASGSQEKADSAAKAFGAKRGYAEGKELINDPAVDVVTIAVKVPDHRDLVLEALAARKHVFCEWPLARDLHETEELAAAAQKAGVQVVIGLQMRVNPVLRRARELIASGAIGRVLSARILSPTVAFGPEVEAAMAFAEQPQNGVTLVTIQGAHTLDFTTALLGPFLDLTATAVTQFPKVRMGDGKEWQARSTADLLLVQARGADGSAASLEVVGGRSPERATFRAEVTGETGELVLSGGALQGFQAGRLSLALNGIPQPVDEGETASMTPEAASVAGLYAALRDGIAARTPTLPDFESAVSLAKLVDSVMFSSESGTRVRAAGWPR